MKESVYRPKILVVDDDKSILYTLDTLLSGEGYKVKTTADPMSGLSLAKDEPFDIVITDIRMPNMDGITFLKKVKKIDPDKTVIMITAFGSERIAVDAMKAGAYDYFSKPFEPDELLMVVRNAVEKIRLQRENVRLRAELKSRYAFANMIGESEPMQRVFDLIIQVKDLDIPVLIAGETGTGKELVAKAIHFQGRRSSMPFIPVNSAALPTDLIESELFGYEKGAFTGATQRKQGRFEAANGGTIFFDEIGDMHMDTQAKILRAIEEKKIMHIGGNEQIPVDVRIIVATNKNLKNLIKEGKFRQDLYYRLNVVNIPIPPLRDRRSDIPLLVSHFINIFNKKFKKNVKGVSEDVLKFFMNHRWAGNVRELKHEIERGVALCKGEMIELSDLSDRLVQEASAFEGLELSKDFSLEKLVADIEKRYIMRALKSTNGVKREAAKLLGISYRMLNYKIARYGISIT